MDPPSAFQHSPFLADLDVHQHEQGNDQASSSPFIPFTDFNASAALDDSLGAAANPSAPPTPYTPSFAAQAGSYHNSPLGSDLGHEFPHHSPNPNTYASATGADQFGDFDISVLPPDYSGGGDDYDPSVYDPPDNSALLFSHDFIASLNDQSTSQSQNNQNSSPSLSTSSLGSNNHGVSVSVTPALDHQMGVYGSGSPYEHGSPASSNGDNDYNPHQQQHQHDVSRSRGSSVSSQPNDFQGSTTFGMEHVRLDMSPNPNQQPSSWAPEGQSQGLQSPPHIYIPRQTPEITHTSISPLPSPSPSSHSLSARDNGNSILPPGGLGMGIQIVPATPISAGVTQNNGFQGMNMMNHGRTSSSSAQSQQWAQPNQHQLLVSQSSGTSLPRLPQAPPSQYSFPPNATLTPPPSGGTASLSVAGNSADAGAAFGALQLSRDRSPECGDESANGNFLVPISNPRSRSKSETSIRPQLWNMGIGMSSGFDTQGQLQSGQGQTSAMQMSGPSFTSHQQSQQIPRLNAQHMPASFGPPVSGSSGFDDGSLQSTGNTNPSNKFLSPDYGASDLRRARSESQGHRRNALSADMTPIFADRSPSTTNGNALYSAGPFLAPGQSGGFNGISISGSPGMMTAGGLHRRSASHGSGHGHSRSLSRDRVSLSASPYPSPHASPRVNANELLPDPYSFPPSSGYSMSSGTFDGSAPTVHVMSHDDQGRPTVQSQAPIQVVRQNVTTHATADASQRRRRTEANFACPVPGCGSTFTRHFNLKGHLRSHNEERPFKCKWPGCDKGFARQHDCKRHEQLHLNIRPYTCQGCQRTFARMDALNRHLRSDAGTDCQSRQPILTTETPNNPAAIAAGIGAQSSSINGNGNEFGDGMLSLQAESDGRWQSPNPVGGVMV